MQEESGRGDAGEVGRTSRQDLWRPTGDAIFDYHTELIASRARKVSAERNGRGTCQADLSPRCETAEGRPATAPIAVVRRV